MMHGQLMKRMSICNCLMKGVPFAQQLRHVRKAGVAGFGLMKPFLDPALGPREVRRMLEDAGLGISIAVPDSFLILSGVTVRDGRFVFDGAGGAPRTEEIKRSMQWFEELRPPVLTVMTGGLGNLDPKRAWDLARAAYADLADFCAGFGAAVGIEPVRPEFAANYSFLGDIDDCRRMVEEIDRPNVGLVIETFHSGALPDVRGQIARAAGRIIGVQLSDAHAHPASIVERLPPGEGVVDIAGMISAIEATGFQGWYDIELPGPDPRSPDERISRSIEGALAAFG